MRTHAARIAFFVLLLTSINAFSQTNSATTPPASHWPTQDGNVSLPNFRFGTGETLPELKLHYLTLGTPHRNAAGHVDNAVLLLHGTGGNAHSLLNPVFSDVLFVPGGILDIQKYFIILPDDIGHGQSSKPSDGMRMHFPAYDYDDMVRSQRMMLDQMKVDHLRLILGTSMGCMQAFVWGETYPGFADALAPFACLPVQIAGRNRMMRYMVSRESSSIRHGRTATTVPNRCKGFVSPTRSSSSWARARCRCRSWPLRGRLPSSMSIVTGRVPLPTRTT